MAFSYMTDKGMRREKNEDSVYADGRLFVVADGMGGHNAGEVASRMAVSVVIERLKSVNENYREEISGAVSAANEKILSSATGKYMGMGTTVDICIVDKNEVHIGHVGDSRVYLIHNGAMTKLTVDHSYVEMLVRKGEITREEAANYPMKNMITRAVGVGDDVLTDYCVKSIDSGDVLLMCTDGLTNALSEDDILSVILSENEPEKMTAELTKKANENGGPDNITVVIALCD